MIDLYTWSTPNGRKISIMLEELGLEYTVKPINIIKDEQFSDSFLKISPNNKIPAIIDHDNDTTLMESGAILLYLANKYKKFLPHSIDDRNKCIEWLFFQAASQGPMLGQAHHFLKFNKGKSEYAENRYKKEAERLYEVMDKRLSVSDYLGGNEYSIADISSWPWVARFDWHQIEITKFQHVSRWYKQISQRSAVLKGYDIPEIGAKIPTI
jgi:GST-like protein